MDEDAKAAGEGTDGGIVAESVGRIRDRCEAIFEEKIDVGGDAREAGNTGIGESLQIFVVGLLDSERSVPRVEFCKRDAKVIKAGT